jgi:hypothetical protein
MSMLRRLRLPAIPSRYRPSFHDIGRRARLRGANRRLADALQQLSLGVPLNWGQVEDDPELETLADIDPAAQECRRSVVGSVPPELRSRLIERLSKGLPAPKPKPVKKAPTSLAGFSENVMVLTQVEEDVPSLISNAPQWIGATFAAGLAVIGILWVLANFVFPVHVATYEWIEVRQGGRIVAQQEPKANSNLVSCVGFSLNKPDQARTFVRLPDDRNQLRSSVGFPVEFLPRTLAISTTVTITPTAQPLTPPSGTVIATITETRTLTYSFTLTDMSVAPCTVSSPDPGDPGAVVKLAYVAQTTTGRRSGTSTPLTFFQAREQPVFLDATNGAWKEVEVSGGRGVYWRGGPYRDVEGNAWIGDVSVLIVERNGIVSTLVGQASQQVTEQMLLGLWTAMSEE